MLRVRREFFDRQKNNSHVACNLRHKLTILILRLGSTVVARTKGWAGPGVIAEVAANACSSCPLNIKGLQSRQSCRHEVWNFLESLEARQKQKL